MIILFLTMLVVSADHVSLEKRHACVWQDHQHQKWAVFWQEVYPTLKIMHLNMCDVHPAYILPKKVFHC